MDTVKKEPAKRSFLKKLLGLGMITAAALYCIPELQETISTGAEWLKKDMEGSQWKNIVLSGSPTCRTLRTIV